MLVTIGLLWTLCLARAVYGASYVFVEKTEAPGNFTRMTSKINVVDGVIEGYYYATDFYFTPGLFGPGGYIGLQPRVKGPSHLTFSFFGNSTSTHPNCGNGADGGTGVSCATDWPWQFNHTYTCEVKRTYHNSTDGSNTWVGNLIDDESGEVVEIGEYTTPATYNLMRGDVTQFDELYLDYPCLPYSKYIQYWPSFYADDGIEVHSDFNWTLTNIETERQDPCAKYYNKLNIAYTIDTENRRYIIENGILPPVPSSV